MFSARNTSFWLGTESLFRCANQRTYGEARRGVFGGLFRWFKQRGHTGYCEVGGTASVMFTRLGCSYRSKRARGLSAADGGKYAGTIRAVTEALAAGAVPNFARLESHQLVFDRVIHRDNPRLPRVSPPDNGPCVTLGQLQAGRFPREHETLGLESIHSIERAPDRTFSDAQLNRNRGPRASLRAQ